MDSKRISDSKNRVFVNTLAIGKDIPNKMSTSPTSIYRVTGLSQIKDILECGYVRPKAGKIVGAHKNEIFWTKGGEKTFYYDKRPVLEVPEAKLKDGQVGAISLDDLRGIWIYDDTQNKYINQIDYFKDLYKERHSKEERDILAEYKDELENVFVKLKEQKVYLNNLNNQNIQDDSFRKR